MSQTLYAPTFKHGWKHFTGGEYVTIVTPEDGGTAYPIRPDGSLCEPRKLRRAERAELKSRMEFTAELQIIADLYPKDA